jgi:pilus assembly protein Flp/PilA
MKTLELNMPVLARFLRDTKGATAVEYAVIATIIGVGIAVGLSAIPEALNTLLNTASDRLQ